MLIEPESTCFLININASHGHRICNESFLFRGGGGLNFLKKYSVFVCRPGSCLRGWRTEWTGRKPRDAEGTPQQAATTAHLHCPHFWKRENSACNLPARKRLRDCSGDSPCLALTTHWLPVSLNRRSCPFCHKLSLGLAMDQKMCRPTKWQGTGLHDCQGPLLALSREHRASVLLFPQKFQFRGYLPQKTSLSSPPSQPELNTSFL